MSTVDRLEGVWNIVPTPFLEDGELDEASLPTLTRFVAGCGVDGMTILGVLGEAAKLSDDERGRVIRGVLAAAGDLPVCVGVSHAATGRAVAFAREAEALGAHSVMLAPPAARAPERRRRAGPLPGRRRRGRRCRSSSRTTRPAAASTCRSSCWRPIADRAPTCRVVKLEDEPSPPKVGRLLALRPDLRVLGGLGAIMLLEELRRGAVGTMTGFGFPEVLVDIVGRYRAGDEAGGPRGLPPRSCRSSGSRTSRASTWPSASTSTSVAGRSRPRSCALRVRRWMRAPSRISTSSSRASGWR